MGRGRQGLGAGEPVLGLVIEQPDNGFGLERRLDERFGAARFAYSTAYNALYRMQRDGLVRVVPSAGGQEREARYEATPAGVEHFRAWLRAPGTLPVLREELHAKIALSGPRELDRLLEMLRDEELACMAEIERIRAAMVAEQPSRARAPLPQQDWGDLMALAVSYGEAAYWGGRASQLSQIRRYLTDLRQEARRRILEEDRRALARRRRAA